MALAWLLAVAGLLLGAAASLIPGFPGVAVALLGLVGFAALTDFTVVTQEAVLLAGLVALFGALSQLAGPAAMSRALGGTAGAATGAALGAAIGVLLPGLSWITAVVGAVVLGLLTSREGVLRYLRGVLGAFSGCLVSSTLDFLAVLGIGAILALSEFTSGLSS